MGTGLMVSAPDLTGIPTIDGNCTTPTGEYSGAASDANSNMRFFAGLRSDSSSLYVCVEVTADMSNDGSFDTGELLFDQNNDNSALPDTNDRLFRVASGGAFTQKKGNTVAWVDCGGPPSCDSGDNAIGHFDGTNEVYEFKIAFADVWGSSSPQPGAVAGLAIVAQDLTGLSTYTWGSATVDENVPSTWGQIQIPEFSDFLLVSVSVVVLVGIQLRRRRS